MERLELYEIVQNELTEYEEQLREMGVPVRNTYRFQRIYLPLADIRPVEIIGNKNECYIEIKGGQRILVKENYEDLCIRINDLENNDIP